MKNTQVIDVLNVPFLEIKCQTKPVCEEMERIQSFGLRFGNRGNIFASRKMQKSSEAATRILDYNSLGGTSMRRYVVEKWLDAVRLLGISIAIHLSNYRAIGS